MRRLLIAGLAVLLVGCGKPEAPLAQQAESAHSPGSMRLID
jgi:hypothetical protein